jgi:hypothetical protein
MLYPRLPTASIVGSDIAHAVPLTLVAGIGHWFLGSIDCPLKPLFSGQNGVKARLMRRQTLPDTGVKSVSEVNHKDLINTTFDRRGRP